MSIYLQTLRRSRWALLVGVAALAPVAVQARQATPSDHNGAGEPSAARPEAAMAANHTVEAIVVTATKRDVQLQDVPFSINAVSGAQLESQNVLSVSELSRIAPDVQAGSSKNRNAFAIRGAIDSSDAAGADHGVGVVIDDVPAAGIADGSLAQGFFDLDRIEILRGPQGTLFGRNTTGGVISIHSRRPSFDPSVRMRAGYGDYGLYQGELFVTGPLSDTVAGKLSISATGRQGWVRNYFLHNTFGHERNLSGRAQLLWKPSEDLNVLVGVEALHSRSDDAAQLYGNFQPGVLQPGLVPNRAGAWGLAGVYPTLHYGPNDSNAGDNGRLELNNHAGFVRADWTVGSAGALTSISGYRKVDSSERVGSDPSPFNTLPGTLKIKEEQFTEELHFASPPDRRFRYVVGGFYLKSTRSYDAVLNTVYDMFDLNSPFVSSSLPALGYAFAFGAYLRGSFPQRTFHDVTQFQKVDLESKAAFGEVDYDLSHRLTLTLGARYTHDDRSGNSVKSFAYTGVLQASTLAPGTVLGETPAGAPIIAAPINSILLPALGRQFSYAALNGAPGISARYEKSWSAFTPKVTLSYRPYSGLMVYATVARGFLAGGFDQRAATAVGLTIPFNPEYVWNYEAGLKGTFLDGRLVADLAVYRQNFDNLQVRIFDTACACSTVKNAASAHSQGFELNVVGRPRDWLTLGVNWSAIPEAKYDDYVIQSAAPPAPPTVFTGNRLLATPKNAANVFGKLTWTLGGRGTLDLSANVSWVSKVWFTESNTDAAFVHDASGKPGIVDLELTWTAPSKAWEVMLWGKNLSDRRAISSFIPANSFIAAASPAIPAASQIGLTSWTPPRTIGATVTYKWN